MKYGRQGNKSASSEHRRFTDEEIFGLTK